MEISCECKKGDDSCNCNGSCMQNICVPVEDQTFAAVSGVPIITAKVGDLGKIVRISGKTETRRHLCELGFTIGECVSVVSGASGNMILDVKGSRIAMDKVLASKIFFAPE